MDSVERRRVYVTFLDKLLMVLLMYAVVATMIAELMEIQ